MLYGLQNGTPKQMLPATVKPPMGDRRQDVGKHVKQFTLSRIFQIPHAIALFAANSKEP